MGGVGAALGTGTCVGPAITAEPRAGPLVWPLTVVTRGVVSLKSCKLRIVYAMAEPPAGWVDAVRRAAGVKATPVILVPQGHAGEANGILDVELTLVQQFGAARAGRVLGKIAEALDLAGEVDAWMLHDEEVVLDPANERAWVTGVPIALNEHRWAFVHFLAKKGGAVAASKEIGEAISKSGYPDVVARRMKIQIDRQVQRDLQSRRRRRKRRVPNDRRRGAAGVSVRRRSANPLEEASPKTSTETPTRSSVVARRCVGGVGPLRRRIFFPSAEEFGRSGGGSFAPAEDLLLRRRSPDLRLVESKGACPKSCVTGAAGEGLSEPLGNWSAATSSAPFLSAPFPRSRWKGERERRRTLLDTRLGCTSPAMRLGAPSTVATTARSA